MEFGFSYLGLIFLVLLVVPNILWTKRQPHGYTPVGESRMLVVQERLGEGLVCFFALTTRSLRLGPWCAWSWWLAAAFCLMALYELWWVRYFRSAHTLADFYSSMLGVPLAGATLPVAAFFLLGIYCRSVWLAVSTVILGIGHIGIHAGHRKDISRSV